MLEEKDKDKAAVKSLRAPQSVIDRFDEIAKDSFESQGQALEALISAYDLASASGRSPGLKSSVDAMLLHTSRIQELYSEAVKAIDDAKESERLASRSQLEGMQAGMEAIAQERDAAARRAADAQARADEAERALAALQARCDSLELQLAGAASLATLTEEIRAALSTAKAAEKPASSRSKKTPPPAEG